MSTKIHLPWTFSYDTYTFKLFLWHQKPKSCTCVTHLSFVKAPLDDITVKTTSFFYLY